MLDADAIKSRYAKVERVQDDLGRAIVVRRMKPSEDMRASEFSDADRTAGVIRVACSVREIDGVPVSFPRNRKDVDDLLDSLDAEGLDAAGKALMTLLGFGPDGKRIDEGVSVGNSSPAQA